MLMKYILSLHIYLRHSLLLFEPKTLGEASVNVIHLASKGKHDQDDFPKRKKKKENEANSPCTHCEKEGHNEEHSRKLHP